MKIAVLGYGTVGSGVVDVIEKNSAIVADKAGESIEVKYVLDLRDFPGDPIQERIVHDYQVILDDPEIGIVAEVMGGLEPAHTFVKKALEAGKSAATSNKVLVERYGAELIAIAKEHQCNFFFEASVGGGIPVIRPMIQCITADKVLHIAGILNGTTNYMLTRMDKGGADYAEVLKEAQDMGYAERNPEADVEGHDACRKIAILTSLAYGKQVDYEDIYTEGITNLTTAEFAYAKAVGAGIKLIASSTLFENGVAAMVSPRMIGPENPLYSVSDVFNGIAVTGNMLGDVMFYGKGAGKHATASAVVSDIVDAVKNQGRHVDIQWTQDKQEILPIASCQGRFFVRVNGDVEADAAKRTELFGQVKTVTVPELPGEYGFLTEELSFGEFAEKAEKLGGVISRIPAEECLNQMIG